jgi:FAD:protein FMN transferase
MNRFFLYLIVALGLGACTTPVPKYIVNDGAIFGTYYHIVYESPKGVDFSSEITDELHRFDMSLSTYQKESVLSKVNQNIEVELDSLFINVFDRSLEIAAITGGTFDPTVAPLVNAWGFGFRKKEQVTDALIDSIKAFVGFQKVKRKNGFIEKDDPRLMLDYSAIAKGYGVDVIGLLLHSFGCKNYMVEIGGEVVAKGINREGKPWRIGINQPNENESFVPSTLQAIVALENKALATSGNYRNFYYEGGKRYAHTIDPFTGYPVEHNLLSATVLATDCMTADAFATAFMVMGLEKAQELIMKRPDIEAFLIYADENGENQLLMTKGFQKCIINEMN